MQPYQERVLAEKRELDERLSKLRAFTKTETFRTLPVADRGLLYDQEEVMSELSRILANRIARF